jgi:hypothetical protein
MRFLVGAWQIATLSAGIGRSTPIIGQRPPT